MNSVNYAPKWKDFDWRSETHTPTGKIMKQMKSVERSSNKILLDDPKHLYENRVNFYESWFLEARK